MDMDVKAGPAATAEQENESASYRVSLDVYIASDTGTLDRERVGSVNGVPGRGIWHAHCHDPLGEVPRQYAGTFDTMGKALAYVQGWGAERLSDAESDA